MMMDYFRLVCEAVVTRRFTIYFGYLQIALTFPLQALPGLYSINIYIYAKQEILLATFNSVYTADFLSSE